ncbi:MAG: hypothetical protein HOV80_28595 [Polyangiaceae bacterium]|nr:hypothetical protein [Polyangiaceae bacterium]
MNTTLPDLEASARRAYERGRVRLGASRALFTVALPLVAATQLGAPTHVAVMLGAVLALVFGYAQFKGRSVGRGARMGLFLGLFGALVPAMMMSSGFCCLGASCESTCLAACIMVGVVAGAAGALVSASDARPLVHGGAAAVIMLLAAGLGCSAVGGAEFLGMAAGLALGGTTFFLRAARAT